MDLETARKIMKLWNEGLRNHRGFPFGDARIEYANDDDDIFMIIHIVQNIRNAEISNEDFEMIKLFLSELANLGNFDASLFINESKIGFTDEHNLPTFDVVIYLRDDDESEE